MIRSKMSGLNVYVYFYDCENDACGSLQLSVALDLKNGTTMDVVNTFNSQRRYARIYLDDERDPYLRFDFEVLHADHAAHIASQIDMWETLLASFLTATGYHDDGEEDDARDAGGAAQGTSGVSSLH